jgi:hypothetical protein
MSARNPSEDASARLSAPERAPWILAGRVGRGRRRPPAGARAGRPGQARERRRARAAGAEAGGLAGRAW